MTQPITDIDWADRKAARLCDELCLNDDPAVEPCFSVAAALRAERERALEEAAVACEQLGYVSTTTQAACARRIRALAQKGDSTK